MTWTKTGTEFADDCANHGLSDAAYRTHHEAITWLYGVEQMELTIAANLVRRFAGSEQYQDAVDELVAVGFWRSTKSGYVVVHHGDVIRASITAQQNQRLRSKKSSARNRAKNAAVETEDETPEVTEHVTEHVTGHADRQTDKHLQRDHEQPVAPAVSRESEPGPGGPQGADQWDRSLVCPTCQEPKEATNPLCDGCFLAERFGRSA